MPPCRGDCSERFPVVYLLDADYSFAIARNIVEHLADRKGLPRLILVGITYDYPQDEDRERSYRINRTRDYTPSNSPDGYPEGIQAHSGGASRFLAFIEHELIPYVDRTLPTIPRDRTLVGHSYGGLFGTYALLTRPDLFQRAILISPSYWYDNHFIFAYEAARSAQIQRLPVRLFLVIGAQEKNSRRDMVDDMQKLAATLARRDYEGLAIHHLVLPGEYHDSVFPGALSTGLRMVFGTFRQ